MDKTVYRGEVYLCDLGKGRGSVQGGVRPCVVVQNNVGNTYSTTVIVAPVTSAEKTVTPTHVNIILDKESIILCEQILTVPKNKLRKKIYKLTLEETQELDRAIEISLGLKA